MARKTEIADRTVYTAHGKRVIKGIFHIQNVNAYHSRFKGWRGFLEDPSASMGFSERIICAVVASARHHSLAGTQPQKFAKI
jgi:hypothetical protein